MPWRHAAATLWGMNPPSSSWDSFNPAASVSAEQLSLLADALAWPLLLMQPDGALVHANLAARRLLRQGSALRLSPAQRVQPAAAVRHSAFEAALQTVARSGQPQMLQWPAPSGRFSATLTALAPTAPDAAASTPLLLLAVAPPEGRINEVRAFAAMHGLSAAETRVLHCLARGLSSSAAAATLGVTPATVRSQIAAVRRKAGQATVGALLQALAALPPLGDDDADDDAGVE